MICMSIYIGRWMQSVTNASRLDIKIEIATETSAFCGEDSDTLCARCFRIEFNLIEWKFGSRWHLLTSYAERLNARRSGALTRKRRRETFFEHVNEHRNQFEKINRILLKLWTVQLNTKKKLLLPVALGVANEGEANEISYQCRVATLDENILVHKLE